MPEQSERDWKRYPDAASTIADALEQLVESMPSVRDLQDALLARSSTRLIDWLDHLVLADGKEPRRLLAGLGFVRQDTYVEHGDAAFHHPGAALPRILLRDGTNEPAGTAVVAAIAVEDIVAFLMSQQVSAHVEGTPLCPYRVAEVWNESGRKFLAVERRGYRGFIPVGKPADYPRHYLGALERWMGRKRRYHYPASGMEETLLLARELVGQLRESAAAWIAFEAERRYWQCRNRAAQAQRARQDGLGLGWANHDHHTFHSSREHFTKLIEILEVLGFEPRECYYAGAEAGWGAQVMEQPACGLAVFADVDLAPEEAERDFAHEPLAPSDALGTVGLWCALHGESMLEAGMHHMAARMDFDAAVEGLSQWGIVRMRPFSDLPYLRQAFSVGERWRVPVGRLERLTADGRISEQDKQRLMADGALGSHLEIIERRQGYKGFSKEGVSDIIRRTDPRLG